MAGSLRRSREPERNTNIGMRSMSKSSDSDTSPTGELSMIPTGERLVTGTGRLHDVVVEHLHRYALASMLCKNKSVLDVASGEGYGSNLLAMTAKSVVGVDISPEAVTHATAKYNRPNLRFLSG